MKGTGRASGSEPIAQKWPMLIPEVVPSMRGDRLGLHGPWYAMSDAGLSGWGNKTPWGRLSDSWKTARVIWASVCAAPLPTPDGGPRDGRSLSRLTRRAVSLSQPPTRLGGHNRDGEGFASGWQTEHDV